MHCPDCGFDNPPGARFCAGCARSLADVKPPAVERRQITVLFCDLVGSTALSELLDPEELHEVIHAYREATSTVVERYGGHVAQFMGDGIMAYFGYPRAHEDDGRRAVRAGLEMQEAVGTLAARGKPLAARVGIHSGLVVVGGSELALGETPNVAARVEGCAAPGQVVVSAATHRLIQGFFELTSMGPHALRGLSKELELFEVHRTSDATDRVEAELAGLTGFVGREAQLNALREHWNASQAASRGVCVRGEAGLGKSRLIEEFKTRGHGGDARLIECRCSPYFADTELHPILAMLERRIGPTNGDADAFVAGLERLGFAATESVQLLASAMNVVLPDDRYEPLSYEPLKQRQRTLDTLVAWLHEQAARSRVLVVVEDLHWADPTTLELLDKLAAAGHGPGLMVLTSARPAQPTPAGFEQVELSPLSADEAARMAGRVAGQATLPPALIERLAERSEGVPLFVEEVTRAVLERRSDGETSTSADGTHPAERAADLVPETVQDSLMARLDHLGSAKPLAQVASTLGRTFRHDLLEAVTDHDAGALEQGLDRLRQAHIIDLVPDAPERTYRFSHALVADAAYGSLLRKTRQEHHARAVKALEESFPHVARTRPELVAHHAGGAGMHAHASGLWAQAGVTALGRAANKEAIGHLQRALTCLDETPEGEPRQRQELDLRLALMPALMAIRGWAAPEVMETCVRARELSQSLGDYEKLYPALWGLWTVDFLRGRLGAAVDSSKQCLGMALATDQSLLHVTGHHAAGFTRYFRAEFDAALEHADQGLALFNLEQERAIVSLFQFSSTVALRVYRACARWMQGHQQEIDGLYEEAETLAKTLRHTPSLAFCQSFGLYVHHFKRDTAALKALAEELMTVSRDQGFLLWFPVGMMFHGWAVAMEGDVEQGLAELEQGLAIFKSTGTELILVHVMTLLAEVRWKAGQVEGALDAIEQGKAMGPAREERLMEPELHRLEGDIHAAQGDAEKARACYRQAVENAGAQGARSLELRALTSLLEALAGHPDHDAVAATLVDKLAWFDGTPSSWDLDRARAAVGKDRP